MAQAPYAMAMELGDQQVNTYILPLLGQQDNALWATFTQVWDMYLEMDGISYMGNHLHNWQVTNWRVWAGGARVSVSVMPTLPGGVEQHYTMVVDDADGAYLVPVRAR